MRTEQREQTVDEVLDEMESAQQKAKEALRRSPDGITAMDTANMLEIIADVRALINTAARGIIVNPTIRKYIEGAIMEALETQPKNKYGDGVNRERVLTLAAYLNSLR